MYICLYTVHATLNVAPWNGIYCLTHDGHKPRFTTYVYMRSLSRLLESRSGSQEQHLSGTVQLQRMAFPRKSTSAGNKHDGEGTCSVRSYRSCREQADYMEMWTWLWEFF